MWMIVQTFSVIVFTPPIGWLHQQRPIKHRTILTADGISLWCDGASSAHFRSFFFVIAPIFQFLSKRARYLQSSIWVNGQCGRCVNKNKFIDCRIWCRVRETLLGPRKPLIVAIQKIKKKIHTVISFSEAHSMHDRWRHEFLHALSRLYKSGCRTCHSLHFWWLHHTANIQTHTPHNLDTLNGNTYLRINQTNKEQN